MSVVNQFGKLFNRKPATPDTGAATGATDDGQDLLATGALDGSQLRDSYQAEAMNSVQGDPDGYTPELTAPEAEEDLISLPLLGRSTAAGHQRRLLALLAVGVVVLALIAGWVLQQADRSAQQLAATGQSLMQSQRLAKSVSQALVGSPQAFPDVVESSGVLARNVRALNAGDNELGVQSLGEPFKPDLDAVNPLMERAERNASVVMGQQKILTQVGDALRTINRQSSDLLEIAETVSSLKLQQNAPAAEISAAGQLVMLTQRIGKSANEFQTMEGVSPEAVFLLGKDLNSFKEIAQGLLEGSPELRLSATKDAQTREQLEALIKLYEQTRTQASAILGNLQGLVSAREAQSAIIADSEPLRRQLEGLQSKLSAQTGLGGQLALQTFQLAAQWLAVGNDGGLCFAGRHQTLQVAQNRAGLGPGLFVQLDQRFQLFAGLRVLGGRQAQLGAAFQQALRDFLEGVQVLAQQEHGLRAHAFHGLELVGRLADTLGQHHQLASGGDFGSGRILLQLERGDRFSDFQQVGRLAVDGAQSVTHLRQDLLLTHHHAGVALGALHQGVDGVQIGFEGLTQRLHTQLVVTGIQGAHVAGQHARAFHHVREGLWATHQRLRHRLGKTLRLHQRLAGSSQLLCGTVGLLQHPTGDQRQHHHTHGQQGQQSALMAGSGRTAQQGQADEVFFGLGCGQLGRVAVGVALDAVHGFGLVGVAQLRTIQSPRGQEILPIVGRAGGCAGVRRGGFPVEQFSKLIDDGHGAALQKNSSTDAQESGMLGQDLQVQLLPACATGIDIGGAEEAG